ncbi:MAG: transporter substrate-binding domain-containing protein [Syntrophobacterales bacterium]
MRFRFWVISLFFLLGTLLFPTVGQCEQKATVAFSEFPPFKIIDNGKLTGIDVDILMEIAKRMDLTLAFKKGTFEDCLRMMQHGEADLMTSLLRRPEREKYIHYVQPNYKARSEKAFYVLEGRRNLIRSYSNLENLKIGVKAGAKYAPIFDNDKDLNKIPAPDIKTNLEKLVSGKIDTFITTSSEGDYYIKTVGYSDKVTKAPFAFIISAPSYIGISKKSPLAKRAKELGRILKELSDKGFILQRLDAYLK